MATSTMTLRDMPAFLAGRWLPPLLGFILLVFAAIIALALAGHDPSDPSLNNVTHAPPTNPVGYPGAVIADMLLQTLGIAGWLTALIPAALGLRMVLLLPPPHPVWPLVALPFALMFGASALSSLGEVPKGWPFLVGIGGFAGEWVLVKLIITMGRSIAQWVSFGVAAVAIAIALGLRLNELVAGVRLVVRQIIRGIRFIGRMLRPLLQLIIRGLSAIIAHGPSWLVRGWHVVLVGIYWCADKLAAGVARVGRWAEQRRTGYVTEEDDEDIQPLRRSELLDLGGGVIDDDLDEPLEDTGKPRRSTAPRPRKPRKKKDPELTFPDLNEGYTLPGFNLLDDPKKYPRNVFDQKMAEETAKDLEAVLDDFGVRGEIVDVKPGPVVTRYDLEPERGTRTQRVIALGEDIARSMRVDSVRIAPVSGSTCIGIEMPNPKREVVALRELFQDQIYEANRMQLPMVLGKDISGIPQVVDLAPMPHLLIAGTTGSGKSVALNAMLLSLLYKMSPKQCRLIMIDPKFIELTVYEDIPHLLCPVVTEPPKAIAALKWVVREMDDRYRRMSHLRVRNITGYNQKLAEAVARNETLTRTIQTGFEAETGRPLYEEQDIDMEPLPMIVVIVDEMADLMLTAGKEVEIAIQRLAGKARAAGIHLIIATQRPSVDVITGVIKSNLPTRISFRVSSKIDSRTILGAAGAEQLLGQGDMLFQPAGKDSVRIHGPLVTEPEIERIVAFLKTQGEPEYLNGVTEEPMLDDKNGMSSTMSGGDMAGDAGGDDPLYQQAVQVIVSENRVSTSFVQRKLRIGYNSAARLIERMEEEGIISPAGHSGKRTVLLNSSGESGEEAPW